MEVVGKWLRSPTEPFQNDYDFEIHTEDNGGTNLQLLQKIQMLTDATEGKTMH